MELHQQAVRREADLDADLASAWDAVADPRRLEEWLAARVDVDIEPGAEGTITDHAGVVRHTVVEEVVPGRRVALRWASVDGEPTLVELTLEPLTAGRTRLVVVEVPVAVVRAVSDRAVAVTRRSSGPALVAA